MGKALFHRLIRRLSACLSLLAACNSQLAAQNYWQQQVNYTIDVSLNADEHSLDGFARIQYINRSSDTLAFIWFQLWPNAYKNDETAFSEQLLGNGRTDFYFSGKDEKGYINRLDFRAGGIIAATEDHPQYIDVVKVILPQPLPPGGQTEITTPFHEQLPFIFSGEGYSANSVKVSEWYPRPAVYDRYGWHPQPYLDQGGSYSEYGNFDIRITVPANYTVAASGELYGVDSSAAPPSPMVIPSASLPPDTHPSHSVHSSHTVHSPHAVHSSSSARRPPPPPAPSPRRVTGTRTLRYRQDNIPDFAWFAASNMIVDHDTLHLPSGRVIDLYACYRPSLAPLWKNGIQYLREAVLFRSQTIGEYPFSSLSAVGVNAASAKATAYPGLIAIPLFPIHTMGPISNRSPRHPRPVIQPLTPETIDSFRQAINHQTGQEWFSSIIGANERDQPWMGEGLSSYYDRISPLSGDFQGYDGPTMTKMAADPQRWDLDIVTAEKKDQPIATSSEAFSAWNYMLIARSKTTLWLRQLEDSLGKELFDSCMRQYFRLWQFRHPYPDDLHAVFETTSRRRLDPVFALLDEKGSVPPFPAHRIIRATALYSTNRIIPAKALYSHRQTDKYNDIDIGPALGYNHYDQFMIGAYIHNLDLPPNRFQFLAAPLIGTNSNRLNGLGGLSYSWYPDGDLRRVLVGLTGSRFSTIAGVDSNGKKIFGGFYKIVPTARLTFRKPSPRSALERWIEWKTYLIGESGFDNYVIKSTDSNYYPVAGKYDFRYLNQLSFYLEDQRVLYPYNALLQFQQASAWWRINFTGNYFFNYEHGGGLNLRLFAAKFGYIGGRNPNLDLSTYEPKLTGVTGSEDYTYSNYFLGRSEFTGLASQQIMIRDGGLKIRTDLFQDLQGRSDNWIAAINFNSSLPPDLVPRWLPLKIFLDVGTYAEAWQDNPPTSRFLYVAGLQLTPFKHFNIYAPLFYSSDFGNQLKTLPDQNTFFSKISFSIDFQTLSFGKKGPDNPF